MPSGKSLKDCNREDFRRAEFLKLIGKRPKFGSKAHIETRNHLAEFAALEGLETLCPGCRGRVDGAFCYQPWAKVCTDGYIDWTEAALNQVTLRQVRQALELHTALNDDVDVSRYCPGNAVAH